MVRVWWVGLVVLGACSFDASGLGRGPGQTTNTTEATGTGTDTTTGGPPTTGGPTTGGSTTMQTGDDSGTATTQDVTITSGGSGGDTSTGTSTGTGTGTSTSTDTGTSTSTGTGTSTGGSDSSSSSSSSTSDASSSSGGDASSSSSTGDAPSCVDGVQNGVESDVDCGGVDCPACADGELCVEGADCVSLHCELGQCVAPSCVDGLENGGETDLDCGGPDCPDCAVGEGCAGDGDCVSGICGPGVCVATACENFKQDGLETGIDCGDVCPACVAPVINEVDYDQELVDDAEFVELYNPGPSPIALAGLRLVLVDGVSKAPYTTVELGPAGVLMPGGFLVVRTPGLAVAPGALTLDFGLAQDNIQNGAPDGIAVVDSLQPALFDALSYEGSIVDANIPPLGVVSLVEGAATPALDEGFTAMVRFPDGFDSDDALSDWVTSGTPTPGAPNVL